MSGRLIASGRARVLAALGLSLLMTAGPAWSQDETVYIGGGSRGSVQVDMSVLDEMGAPRASQGSANRVVLRPPSQQQPRETASPRTATTAKPAARSKPAAAPTRTASAPPPAATPRPPEPVAPPRAVTPRESAAAPPTPPPANAPPPEPKANMAAPISAPSETLASRQATATPAPATAVAPAAMSAPETPGASASITRAAESAGAAPAAAVGPSPVAAVPAVTAPAMPTPAPVATPAPEPAKPVAPPTQTAALAPSSAPSAIGGGARDLRIPFGGEAAVLSDPAKGEIKQLAGALAQDQALRVQVKAYAGGSEDASKARRLSLSRALAVRAYLIEQGIGSTRIDVRALGNNAEGGPADRVDLVVVTR